TPRSPPCFGSRSPSLFVPTSTTPLATTGLPYDCDPSFAIHFTFLPVLTSHCVGTPVMDETMLRLGVPPHIGQSAAVRAAEAARIPQVMIRRFIFLMRSDLRLLVRVHTHVVEVNLGDAVAVQPGAAVLVRDAVDLLDGPRLRLHLADGP